LVGIVLTSIQTADVVVDSVEQSQVRKMCCLGELVSSSYREDAFSLLSYRNTILLNLACRSLLLIHVLFFAPLGRRCAHDLFAKLATLFWKCTHSISVCMHPICLCIKFSPCFGYIFYELLVHPVYTVLSLIMTRGLLFFNLKIWKKFYVKNMPTVFSLFEAPL
jgi:hypothetical protein